MSLRAGACAALVAVVSLVAGCASSSTPAARPSAAPTNPYQGFGVVPPQPRPDFTLRDTSGASYAFGSRTAGHPTLLYFGYTHCPDVCPTTLADIHAALAAVPEAVRARTLVVFVTTDPARDTGPVIAAWLAHFSAGLAHATFIGLTGTQSQIDTAQTAARVTIAQDAGQMHSASVMLYGPDDLERVSFALSDNETQQLTHDLPLVAGS